MELIKDIGSYAGLVAFVGLALLALLSFTQGRDIRRLREWAGSAPERDTERKESTSAAAAERAEEMRRLEEARESERKAAELREQRRRRREEGLPELTRSERVRERLGGAGDRLGEPIYLVALFLVVLVVAGGIFYLVTRGDGNDGGDRGRNTSAKVKPADIEVSVLNGTAVSGLAGQFGDLVERKGFSLGVVTNSASSFNESVVMFARGSAPEARRVGKALGISEVRLMTPEIAEVSGGTPVSVVVGEDNASSTP
ncbi:MAG TPA: LytR C-terminal domain-containing protein [Solirubrobacterales bacterium]